MKTEVLFNDGWQFYNVDLQLICIFSSVIIIPKVKTGVIFFIFLKQDKDRFRVSLRSKKGTSANLCAKRYFNGGGHELASGGRLMIPDDVRSPREAAEYIRKVTHQFMKGNE